MRGRSAARESGEGDHRRPKRSRRDVATSGSTVRSQRLPTREPPPRRHGADSRSGPERPKRRSFSKEEVVEMLAEVQRRMLGQRASLSPERGGDSEEWKEVESRSSKRKRKEAISAEAKATAEGLVDEVGEREVARCWRCKESGHLSFSCPSRDVCYYCHKEGHFIKDCPIRIAKEEAARRRLEGRTSDGGVGLAPGDEKVVGEGSRRPGKREVEKMKGGGLRR